MRYLVEVIEAEQSAQPQSVQAPAAPAHRTVNVVDAGADPAGVKDSTAAINGAIRRVHEAGGGTVHLPAGTACPRRSLNCLVVCICRVLVASRPSSLLTLALARNRRRQSSTPAAGSPRVSARTIC